MFLVEQNVHQTLAVSSYGYVLSKGRVVAEGVPQELAGRAEVRDAYFAGARSIFPKRGCHPHQVRGRLCRDHALGALWMDCAHVHKARQFAAALLNYSNSEANIENAHSCAKTH